ncbi:MAG: asparaginase domain-containing protein, partial [Eubacteriales bacterium]|nr:asparaginase domain-containing protein [Eubacteriales bacterium]
MNNGRKASSETTRRSRKSGSSLGFYIGPTRCFASVVVFAARACYTNGENEGSRSPASGRHRAPFPAAARDTLKRAQPPKAASVPLSPLRCAGKRAAPGGVAETKRNGRKCGKVKKILLLATGGTIASRNLGEGLTPALTAEELLGCVPEIADVCDVTAEQVCNLD